MYISWALICLNHVPVCVGQFGVNVYTVDIFTVEVQIS